MLETILPLGKLPPDLLARLISSSPSQDPRLILGPGIGLDCAVVDAGNDNLMVYKIEPITFATNAIGWYAVQVAANDIATTGATPRWYLATLLLPQSRTTPALVEDISGQIQSACQALGITLIGGHTEITYGLDRPILVGTLVGEVTRDHLVTPLGAVPGDQLLLTKGVPIEATSLLAREFGDRLAAFLTSEELLQAANFLYSPGISIVKDAVLAAQSGEIHAMHDPTEGGLASALWELAEASGKTLIFDPSKVPIPSISQRICQIFSLDPLATIASGALLLAVPSSSVIPICSALQKEGIACAVIGQVEAGTPLVWQDTQSTRELLPRPERDEITKVYG